MADARPRADDDWIAKEFEAKQYFTPATPVDEYEPLDYPALRLVKDTKIVLR